MRFEGSHSDRCPVCGTADLHALLDLGTLPVFCNVQFGSREEAARAAMAPFRLAGCGRCGHTFNIAFEPGRVEYAPSYDSSQHFSATFHAYADELVTRLVDTYGLRGATVVDVGCGKGDLLKLLCRAGRNRGFGFDTSYDGDPEPADAPGTRFEGGLFDVDRARELRPSLVSCRHVLEHVPDPVAFLGELAKCLATSPDGVLYIEVPNGQRQLHGSLLWDYIYEHYSYFSPDSLRLALESAGLEVLRLETGFGGQFLCADARLRTTGETLAAYPPSSGSGEALLEAAPRFMALLEAWRRWAEALPSDAGTTVLWGAGSKGVTFVNLLDLFVPGPVERIVDQNPGKHGRFVARTGQEIIAPEALLSGDVSTVLVMNPIYTDEISRWLEAHGVDARVIDATMPPAVA
jgi:SAM-dependent methyltransferase